MIPLGLVDDVFVMHAFGGLPLGALPLDVVQQSWRFTASSLSLSAPVRLEAQIVETSLINVSGRTSLDSLHNVWPGRTATVMCGQVAQPPATPPPKGQEGEGGDGG